MNFVPAVIPYPRIDPVAFRVGPLSVHWYGIAYILAFAAAWLIIRWLNRRWEMGLSDDDLIDIMLAAVLGVVVGGRIGYVLFYDASAFVKDPLFVFRIWQGGMSFHGGLIGLVLAGLILCWRKGWSFLEIADLCSPAAPIGIFFGRIANFVNGELWGRPSNVPWAMVFPGAGPEPRHPSQLYEAFFEGLLLFVILLLLARKPRQRGQLFGIFLTVYGLSRIAMENFRQPDAQLGFLFGPVTMGMLLSLPVLLAGIAILAWSLKKGRPLDGGEARVGRPPKADA